MKNIMASATRDKTALKAAGFATLIAIGFSFIYGYVFWGLALLVSSLHIPIDDGLSSISFTVFTFVELLLLIGILAAVYKVLNVKNAFFAAALGVSLNSVLSLGGFSNLTNRLLVGLVAGLLIGVVVTFLLFWGSIHIAKRIHLHPGLLITIGLVLAVLSSIFGYYVSYLWSLIFS